MPSPASRAGRPVVFVMFLLVKCLYGACIILWNHADGGKATCRTFVSQNGNILGEICLGSHWESNARPPILADYCVLVHIIS